MRTRVVGLTIFGLCVVVTVVAAAVGLGRGGAAQADGLATLPFGDAVAIVRLDGAITDATVAPVRGRADSVYAQLRRAEQDGAVKAVVLRVNSPGGSASASQTLYEQIVRMRRGGKPVVVHFTDVAASGGYYVAAAGDRIVSQPTAITGSIGVILSSPDVSGLYEKIGVRERVIKSGPYKDIFSSTREITPEERAILDKLVQDTLDQFVKVVVEGRKLPDADVRQVADGRIFSGTEALRLRLVDEVGDQYRAVRLAGELAGLRGEPRIVLYDQPRQGGLLELLSGSLPGAERLEQLLPEPGVTVRYEWKAGS
jgi:protease IV